MIGVHTGQGSHPVHADTPLDELLGKSLSDVTIAPLVVEYGSKLGEGANAWIDVTLMIAPPPTLHAPKSPHT